MRTCVPLSSLWPVHAHPTLIRHTAGGGAWECVPVGGWGLGRVITGIPDRLLLQCIHLGAGPLRRHGRRGALLQFMYVTGLGGVAALCRGAVLCGTSAGRPPRRTLANNDLPGHGETTAVSAAVAHAGGCGALVVRALAFAGGGIHREWRSVIRVITGWLPQPHGHCKASPLPLLFRRAFHPIRSRSLHHGALFGFGHTPPAVQLILRDNSATTCPRSTRMRLLSCPALSE